MLLPAMPHDEVEADQLAPSHLDGTQYRATIGVSPLRGVRQHASLGQAVAIGRRAGEAFGAARLMKERQWFGVPRHQLG